MATRSIPIFRGFTTNRALLDSLKEPLKVNKHHELSHSVNLASMWKKMFFFVGCPAIVLSYVNVMMAEQPPRPEFVKYPYLRIRNKKYPWRDGVKTLFHNPHANPLPDGYEDQLH